MQNYLTILLSILLLSMLYLVYILGITKQENKQYKSSNKLQKKINKTKKANKETVISKLKKSKFIFILFIFLSGCYTVSSNLYIPLEDYTEQEQKELAEFLEKNNNQLVDKVIIDYYNLRETVRIINKN